jgi:hypothetical protein
MFKRFSVLLLLLLSTVPMLAQASPCEGDKDALTASRDWWRAYATGDLAFLEERTASQFSWTSSIGSTYDRKATLAKAASHDLEVVFDWKEGAVHNLGPASAIVTNRLIETITKTPPAAYRSLAVLECSGGRWRVAAAQSTRETELSIRVPDANPALHEFAGGYQAPGGILQISTDGAALVLTDPAGRRTRLESVGTHLFEPSAVAAAGAIRFVFHRGTDGKVASMTRIASTITTFPRLDVARERTTKE